MSYGLWVLIAIIALALDMVTATFLFVWFTIGGIAAVVAAILNYSFSAQLVAFLSVSAVCMAIGYPLVKKTLKKTVPKTLTMEEGYIGRELIVSEEILEKASIKFDGIYWTMKNEGEPIKQGDKVKVTGIEGNKLIVKKIDSLEGEN